MARTDPDEGIRPTYLGLRLALLYLAVVIQPARFGCLQSSLSDYYYTPARPVFIAALCAIGACLIIYRGTTTIENALLDVAGFVVFLIAFVPVGCTWTTTAASPPTSRPRPTRRWPSGSNGLALFLARRRAGPLAAPPRHAPMPVSTKVALLANVVLLVAGTALFLLDPAAFARIAHLVAAGPTIGFRIWIFWAETIGIAGFAVFWLTQTRELGGLVNRTGTGR